MSDTTLYSGLYQQISEYAERLDMALITFVTQQPNPNLYQELGNMLAQFAAPHQGRLANRLIAQMILEDDAVGQDELEVASKTLQAGAVDEMTKDVIERLAHSLEQERTKAIARMRGELR